MQRRIESATLHTGRRICFREDLKRRRMGMPTRAALHTRRRTLHRKDFHAGNQDTACASLVSQADIFTRVSSLAVSTPCVSLIASELDTSALVLVGHTTHI